MIDVGLLVFDEVDLLDFGGPYEVFLTADRLNRRLGEPGCFTISVVGPSLDPVTAYGGVGLLPGVAAENAPPFDVVVIPGAVAIDQVAARPEIKAAVAALADRAGLVTSVCTGAFLLADAGYLAGKPWTTHFEDVEALGRRSGSGDGRPGVRWIDAGTVITSGGLSCGLAMALHVVDRTVGRELAEDTARQLEYGWDPAEGIMA